ncbi:MAG: NAD kinase [Flavobacteriales bacterium]|jgi:NAD+ kinase|nr:NAD kinase [Flavobacteriales bacterium]MBT4706181.1 NAD kinase [Flavobacteriales bacterium]MBT5133200.1 NAD kinase [Flavobacteriales bacterium]MBT5977210.1 NAD kinase [Flavobacteriales bacterium]MBT6383916.1 NAD kinase [Flavobacteriales bacterium]
MKKFAIYGREFKDEHLKGLQHFFELMDNRKAEYQIYDHFATYLSSRLNLKADIPTFSRESFDPSDIDIMLSIGGDGTMLDTTTMIKDSNLPILGINTGRLGFLSSINLNQIDDALAQIFEGAYMIDKRTVLKVETDEKIFEDENFALNEVTLHKKDSQSMIVIHVYVDGKFLNTYWADGLIIATPTGSTAYSLSCGGPIILPGSHNLIITPVAPHNLNVRPVLISDQSVITLKMEGRDSNFLMSLDSRSTTLKEDAVVTVQRHSFSINLVRLKNHSFLKTLRNKLHWGYDRRN